MKNILPQDNTPEERDPYDNIRRHHANMSTKLRKYGVGVSTYDEMHKKQDGLCAICGKPETEIYKGKVRLLSIDHSHTTGKVRKLLCTGCNRALGFIKENADTARNMARYIEEECQ